MDTVIRTYLTDDIDAFEDDLTVVEFALGRAFFEIDVRAANEDRLVCFVDAASPAKQPRSALVMRADKSATVAFTNEQTRVVRDCAKAAGLAVAGFRKPFMTPSLPQTGGSVYES